MARKPKINLSQAQTSNGALPSFKSVYEAVGIPTTGYTHKTLADYSKTIKALNLIELQDHAYEVGVLAGPDRETLIDRLERKFIQDHIKFSGGITQPIDPVDPVKREEAEKLLFRRR